MGVVQEWKPNPKVAFDIGWDYFAYGMLLPGDMKDNKDALEGFRAARNRKVKPAEHDRYIRKWLLLRANAWRRGRIFDEDVTPDFLKKIDVDRCPITLQALGHGSGAGSDWSVDRVNNNGGYAVCNLVVVSALANISKGDHTLEDMLSYAYDDTTDIPLAASKMSRPLTRLEWARWALICSHAGGEVDAEGEVHLTFCPVPCVIVPPLGLLINSSSELQIVIAGKKYSQHERRVFDMFSSRLPKPKRRVLNDLCRLIDKKTHINQHGLDIWLNRRVFDAFVDFYSLLTVTNGTA